MTVSLASSTIIGSTENFKLYFVDTRISKKEKLAGVEGIRSEKFSGSLAITIKMKKHWFIHRWISKWQKLSAKQNGLPADCFKHAPFKINDLMHGAIVASKPINGKLDFIHANQFGVVKTKQDLNDKYIDGLLLIVPKDKSVRQTILSQAKVETRPGKSHTNYNYFRALTSIFYTTKLYNQKPLTENAYTRLAGAVVDTLNKRAIMTREGKPKAAICTAFAMRTLQAAQLLSRLTKAEKEAILELPTRKSQIDHLKKWLQDTGHPAGAYILKNTIFRLRDSNTLPYHIFHAIMGAPARVQPKKTSCFRKAIKTCKRILENIKQLFRRFLQQLQEFARKRFGWKPINIDPNIPANQLARTFVPKSIQLI